MNDVRLIVLGAISSQPMCVLSDAPLAYIEVLIILKISHSIGEGLGFRFDNSFDCKVENSRLKPTSHLF